MRNYVLAKRCWLILLIAGAGLVDAFENDDLVFDQEGKQSFDESPLIVSHGVQESILHRIKRGFFDFFVPKTSTTRIPTTTTEALIDQNEEITEYENENAAPVEADNNEKPRASSVKKLSNFERLARDSGEKTEETDERDNEIGNVAEARREPPKFGNTDDEDLAGSGEVEGSATYGRQPEPGKEGGRYYRITLTVGEPYVAEYADRNSQQYKELSGNLTEALEDLYNRNIPSERHHANVVKISPTSSDVFTSLVTVDIGSSFTDELEVKNILEKQLQYHSLGNINVNQKEFTFRVFQAGAEEDEQECDASTELICRNGACVPLESRCDGISQCTDGSDEDNCPVVTTGCNAGEFACDVSRCILESQRCNYIEECQDGTDEHNCNYPACTSTQFRCKNGECIDSSDHCNGIQDCHDDSDELNCPCAEDEFECTPRYCVTQTKRCDGVMDCSNGKDEENCSEMTRCRPDEFECVSNGDCVSRSARCDGRSDCLDRSDEFNCSVTTCSGDQFRCLDGTCLSIDKRCNQVIDCRNGEDENQCGCGKAEFRCADGRCIGYEFQCNGVEECSDGSDERDCEKSQWLNVYNDERIRSYAKRFKTLLDLKKCEKEEKDCEVSSMKQGLVSDAKPKRKKQQDGISRNRINHDDNSHPRAVGRRLQHYVQNDNVIANPVDAAFPELSESKSKISDMLSGTILQKLINRENEGPSLNKVDKKPDNFGRFFRKPRNSTKENTKNPTKMRKKSKKHLKKKNRKNNTNPRVLVQDSKDKVGTNPEALVAPASTTIMVDLRVPEIETSVTKHGSRFSDYFENHLNNLIKKIDTSTTPNLLSSSESEIFHGERNTFKAIEDTKESDLTVDADKQSKNVTGTVEAIAEKLVARTDEYDAEMINQVNGIKPMTEEDKYNSLDLFKSTNSVEESATQHSNSSSKEEDLDERFKSSSAFAEVATTRNLEEETSFKDSAEELTTKRSSQEDDDDNNLTTVIEKEFTKFTSKEEYVSDTPNARLLEKDDEDLKIISEDRTSEVEVPFLTEETLHDAETEDIYGYKAKKHGSLAKYFHKYLKGSVTPSFASSTSSVIDNADANLPVNLESGLFESNSWNNVEVNLQSTGRLSNELPRNSSLSTQRTFKNNVDTCTSKCREYWRKTFGLEKTKSRADIDENLNNKENVDSGLISSEGTATMDPEEHNCTDGIFDIPDSEEIFNFTSIKDKDTDWKTSHSVTTATESTNLVEVFVDLTTRKPRTDKKKPKHGKKRKNDKSKNKKKGKKSGQRDRTKESTTSGQRETTSSFDQRWNSPTWTLFAGITSFEVTSPSSEEPTKEFLSKETVDREENQTLEITVSTDLFGAEDSPATKKKGGKTTESSWWDLGFFSNQNSEEDSKNSKENVTEQPTVDLTMTSTITSISGSEEVLERNSSISEEFTCNDDQFQCDGNVCIAEDRLCDAHVDCVDASDETNCYYIPTIDHSRRNQSETKSHPASCGTYEFICDGSCISAIYSCDGFADCQDGADEAECGDTECPEGQQPCDNGVCINSNFFCDNNVDCHDGSDERDCPETGETNPVHYPASCRHDEFMCRDRSCIPRYAVCDGRRDCPHEDDEMNCDRGCGKDQFQCANGNCIKADQKCNGFIECADGSDESEGCDSHPTPGLCPTGYIVCTTDRNCVPQSSICNGVPECRDGSDEKDCDSSGESSYLNLKTYPSEQVIKESREVVFQCRDEGPIRARVRWLRGNNRPLPPNSRDINGRLEIPNIQLEHAGPYICEAVGQPPSIPGQQVTVHLSVEKFEPPATNRPHVCQYDEATCSNGDCIPKSYVCNGRLDCTDGSDEMRCSIHGCEPNEFRCNNTQCVGKLWRCDGDMDCADGSDEEHCAPSRPGSLCEFTEYACASGQCIPKSYHCDRERDCMDGTDEIGCSPVYIVKPPPPMITLERGENLVIVCTAIGVPTPEINWRLNWGHIPPKCTMTSVNGTGTLTCPDIQTEDQGAYSCEGLNNDGFVFAVPDAIVMVNRPGDICPKGMFNSEARTLDECISCFCFGVATECHSANLFTYQIPPPLDRHKVVNIDLYPILRVTGDVNTQALEVTALGRDSVQLYASNSIELSRDRDRSGENVPYFALPEHYHGSQLKSYGGYLKYKVRYNGTGTPNSAPSVVMSGNNYVLVHRDRQSPPNYDTERSVRFFQGEWYKQDGRDEVPATREDIMMTLARVDNILIKAQYDDSPYLDVQISNIVMDTADARNTGLGSASYVEECRCPSGYSGLSCEQCAPGYLRRKSGPWLGQCYRDEQPCPPGYYGDPSRNIPCQVCPCPLTNPSNQFARTCHLGSDGTPTCDCPPGYVGHRCERCDSGYQGNPLIPGDMCVPARQCDPDGSLSEVADPITGQCRCKHYTTGLTCNQCKANTFNLASKNQYGCISCFCMGISDRCVSSNWYRNDIRVSFTNSIRDFSLIESKIPDALPITEGIRLDTVSREIVFSNFPNRGNNDVYYWQLPSIFLGNRITSYGGDLKYTVRYVPAPGGQSSRNNAADVELISANNINLLYFSRESPEPNTPQTFTVPLLEQFWQRTDGTQADREHMLMALADVSAIRIKATYTTHTNEAALSLVFLDTADKYNTGRTRAVEVEECTCPIGYKGLSCEDCDVGYTRSDQGVYLGGCEPCNCNGHSRQCNPDTGICENCEHHTTGEFCDVCEPGYEGDATRGTPYDCVFRRRNPTHCNCNEAGSRSSTCVANRCDCKRNVEGPECNRCRPSTFGLSANNPDGCSECYCSGVTDQCHESSLYVQQIPVLIYDAKHGFTLTDSTRQEVIDEGFELNIAMNEIGYRYPDSRGRRLFWSLPPVFTGNKVKSYGGNLILTQHITAHPGAQSYKDQDIILVGNGITLFWTNPVEIQPNIPLTYTVPLRESEWRRLTMEGPRVASHVDIMTVLSNLEAILVRASHSERMAATYISDISLDTAVEHATGNRRAVQVEVCRCPMGYVGTSCESCARGYYRDTNNRSVSYLGSCIQCPCNGNEESCDISRTGQVKCHCQEGYTGQYCQQTEDPSETTTIAPNPNVYPPKILVHIKGPELEIVKTGTTVRYHCSGRALDDGPLHVKWEKLGGQLPPGRSVDDNLGLLIIRDVKVSDSGIYVCQVSDGVHVAFKNVTLTVGGSNPVSPRAIVAPTSLQVVEGEPAEFRCEASGNPPPQVEWIRVHGAMNPEVVIHDGVWFLQRVTKNDAAEYRCLARNNVGVDEQIVILYVREYPPPRVGLPPTITPLEWTGKIGEVIRITCTPSDVANVTWTRDANLPLPRTANQRDGVLTIMNPTLYDSGIYVCTAISYLGSQTNSTITITVLPHRVPASVRVKPEMQTVPQGNTAEVRCVTGGEPGEQITWSKHHQQLNPNAQNIGDTLRIVNVQVSDRGVYICHVTGPNGNHEASAVIEVEPREAPRLELYPKDTQTVRLGGSADIQCRAIAGIPVPELRWYRQDGRPFLHNIRQLPGGILTLSNITIDDGGAYVCSAMNSVGSDSAVAYIDVQSVPVITVSPSSGILNVKRGDRVQLTCSANGIPQPNVEWTKHVDGIRESYSPVFRQDNGTPRTAVYEIYSVSDHDEGSYTCHAMNAAGVVEERVHIRIDDDNEVYPPCRGDVPCTEDNRPTHTDHDSHRVPVGPPQDYFRIPTGGKVEMRCQALASDGNHILLDWKRSDHLPLPKGSTVHNGILNIPDVDKSAAGEYVCLGMDHAGTILFKAKSHLEVLSLPRIVLKPPRQTVGPGENPSIRCSATGDEPMTIEWEAIGRSLPYSVSHDRGILQFHGITYSDAGKYVCKATNDAGTAEAVAEVLVNEHSYEDMIVRADQRDVVTYVGQPVRLRCIVRERTTIHWSREGLPLPSYARIEDDYLELPRVRPDDSGRYTCQIQTAHGVSSDYINLNVSPTVMQPAVSVEVSQDPVNIGDTIDIRCACTGTRNPRYHWSRPNHPSLPPNSQEYENVLRLTSVTVDDSGYYRCTAETSEGIFERDFNLVVHGGHNDAPAIETKYAPYGSSVEMNCRPNLDSPDKFQWSKLGGLLPRDAHTFESKLNLTNVKAEDAGTYICTVNNDHESIEIPTVLVVTGVVPYFSQAPESFIALPPLPDCYLKFNIEVSFKPESYDGIILYNDEGNRGDGDFIMLSLMRGYPQFSFNLGSGPTVIQADKPVSLSEWHTVKLQRDRKEGTMLVDGEGPYKGTATGRKQGLDLKELMFVGGVPNYNIINKNAEMTTGFVGCISRLVIGEKEVDLNGNQADSIGITNCETCAENPCNNGGVCQEAATKNGYTCLCRADYSGKHCDNVGQSCFPGACGEGNCVDKETGFECYCPYGKTGQRCEKSMKIYEPAFHDDKSFIAHNTPKALRRTRMSTTHNRLQSRNAQVRSRPHHHNNLHHTKH